MESGCAVSFLCAGAGSAGLGVCAQIVDGMVEAGLPRDEAMKRFVICTSVGAIGKADGQYGDPNASRGLSDERAVWVNEAVSDGCSLEEAREGRSNLPSPSMALYGLPWPSMTFHDLP